MVRVSTTANCTSNVQPQHQYNEIGNQKEPKENDETQRKHEKRQQPEHGTPAIYEIT